MRISHKEAEARLGHAAACDSCFVYHWLGQEPEGLCKTKFEEVEFSNGVEDGCVGL
jgi:hypothetical protein